MGVEFSQDSDLAYTKVASVVKFVCVDYKDDQESGDKQTGVTNTSLTQHRLRLFLIIHEWDRDGKISYPILVVVCSPLLYSFQRSCCSIMQSWKREVSRVMNLSQVWQFTKSAENLSTGSPHVSA
jgi:hypothetical protein